MQLPHAASNAPDAGVAAFPARLADDVRTVLAYVPDSSLAPVQPFEVEAVRDHEVRAPSDGETRNKPCLNGT
ncbi:hypothetical protein [Streptomyces sp. NPDC090298]|uniref:hypothetical protein n=1 Tax=Streptomyces sp. NPDC090298 TaxID=3365959 RepID=UPI0038051671